MPSLRPTTATTVYVDLSEFKGRLLALGKRAVPAVRRSMYAGANVIRDEARRKVPVRTGALKKSIISVTNRKGSSRDLVMLQVKIDAKAFAKRPGGKVKTVSKKVQKQRGRKYVKGEIYPRNYGHLVEYGTKPHMVGNRMHPGAQPKPFMRPAFNTKADEAASTVRQVLTREIEKEVQKISSGRAAG